MAHWLMSVFFFKADIGELTHRFYAKAHRPQSVAFQQTLNPSPRQ